MVRHHILILGGTTESRELAGALSARSDIRTTLSLAGRTADPIAQPVPVRSGGFGGVEGLTDYLRNEQIDLLIDATHPFAVNISRNAGDAANQANVPLLTLRRLAWEAEPGDRWLRVHSVADAVTALGQEPKRVFLAIGRQEAHLFERAPQHSYLIRSVDPTERPLNLPDARTLLATGPFATENEIALLKDNAIDIVVAKNSGGAATYGKIAAARILSIPVVMVDRQPAGGLKTVATVEEALAAIDHVFSGSRNLGV